ncbi:hypothetical protein ACPGAX_004541 [Enterobacter quasiroggenkampii]
MCQTDIDIIYESQIPPVIYCYELAGDVIFFPEKKILMNTEGTNFFRVKLRTTMGNLLHFLLTNARSKFISDDEIMVAVWEKNGLRASSHRLWQVSKELNYKLQEAGLTIRIFQRGKKGFFIDTSLIIPFYKDIAHSHSARSLKE